MYKRQPLTSPLSTKVVSEDENTTNVYTLKATVASTFVDVPEDAWYYDYVMEAAKAGICILYTSTVISQAVSGLGCFLFILKKMPLLHVGREDLKPCLLYTSRCV